MNMRYTHRHAAARQYQGTLGDGGRKRLSLMDPRFNFREIAKQMVLLEDHLSHARKHCPDCIRKHLLTIEAFAEEAVSLDKGGRYRPEGENLAEAARVWLERIHDGVTPAEVGQEIRGYRKRLVRLVADPREVVSRVASRYLAQCPHNP